MKYLHLTDGRDGVLSRGPDHWTERVPRLLQELGHSFEETLVVAAAGATLGELATLARKAELARDFDFVSFHAGIYDVHAQTPESGVVAGMTAMLDLASELARGEPSRTLLVEPSVLEGRTDDEAARIGRLIALERRMTMERWLPHILFSNDLLGEMVTDDSDFEPTFDFAAFGARCAVELAGQIAHVISHPTPEMPTREELERMAAEFEEEGFRSGN